MSWDTEIYELRRAIDLAYEMDGPEKIKRQDDAVVKISECFIT